ncbi:Na+/H+ antiporter subunit E [Schleiferia thermophila]|uniref:Multicomponent Na+:H+ antiporter subunit E n=1 Tax=Schleiferia thermophila TaxID=884107 RepID=A0A368ZWK4_9FLAO|nr:Na+/H+ antiporter subunit E [Schleiferia thermophila]RCX01209.1 multicomponent Na+:H+ antiporter subunit E [Schleiferia thermophila]GCD80536.1 cation:proton antiporter [Schleiferia thermophila]
MRAKFLMNNLLAFVWVALTGALSVKNFLFGFILSYFILWLISRGLGSGNDSGQKYFILVPRVIAFFFFFLYELLKANLQVAYDVITPKSYMAPGIVRIPLDVTTSLEITLLANLISLTPGTLSLDVSDDKKVLYVHGMFVKDKEEFIRSIKQGFERRILELTR